MWSKRYNCPFSMKCQFFAQLFSTTFLLQNCKFTKRNVYCYEREYNDHVFYKDLSLDVHISLRCFSTTHKVQQNALRPLVYFHRQQCLTIAKDANEISFLFFYTCLRCWLANKIKYYKKTDYLLWHTQLIVCAVKY